MAGCLYVSCSGQVGSLYSSPSGCTPEFLEGCSGKQNPYAVYNQAMDVSKSDCLFAHYLLKGFTGSADFIFKFDSKLRAQHGTALPLRLPTMNRQSIVDSERPYDSWPFAYSSCPGKNG